MAITTGTLRDIAALNGRDKEVGILDEVLGSFPELNALPGRTIKGTTFKATLRKNNPKGGFRRANAGVTPGAAGYYEKNVQTFIYENPIIVDAAVADASEDGREEYLAARSEEHVAGAFEGIGEQVYYGLDSEDELGFPGLKALGEDEFRINATGANDSTVTTGFLVRIGTDGVQFLFGNNQGINVPAFREQAVPDPSDLTKIIPRAYISPMGLWIGLQAVHPKSIVKICNLNTAAGKGFTDALVQQALELMPAGFRNDKGSLRLLLNGRTVGQLQTSRTAVSQVAYKSGAVADRPTESHGIQIIETDSIKIGAAEYEAFA